jgi:hypothetical protein
MKGVTVFAKFRQFFAKVFCENFLQKPQSDEKWNNISVEKEYMEPDLWFSGLLDRNPDLDPWDSDLVQILVVFEEKGNSMLKIISVWEHLKVMVTSYKTKFLFDHMKQSFF